MSASSDKPAAAQLDINVLSERLVVLISHERSGSHYLTDLLSSTKELSSLDEVCNFDAINPEVSEASFFRFRLRQHLEEPELAYRPDAQAMSRFLDRFFMHLLSLRQTPRVLVDIKYAHVHNFEMSWWPTSTRPFLLAYLEKRNVPIIHLTRRDAIAATVSTMLAEQTGIWHSKSAGNAQLSGKIRIPVLKAVNTALALEHEKQNFYRWLLQNRSFDIEYEDFAMGNIAECSIMDRLCDFLGFSASRAPLSSSHWKVTPPVSEAVENFEELVRVASLFGEGRFATSLKIS
jgi:LPS sulfotransferase NodH